jgi:starch synthase
MHILEYGGAVNLTKGAIEAADAVSTVSPAYAREILTPAFSCGLDDFLQKKRSKIFGILNGINISAYNPLTDPYIAVDYGIDDCEAGKRTCKKALREEFGLEEDDSPLASFASPFTEDRGIGLLRDAARELLGCGIQLIVAGNGDSASEKFFGDLSLRSRGRVGTHIGFSNELERRIYAGSDIFLIPSQVEPCGFEQMAALRYGTVPVARKTGGLRDTVRDNADSLGNGFTFDDYGVRGMLVSCLRARNAYRQKEEWKGLVQRAMRCDNSWATSATKYIDMYHQVMTLW